MKRTGKVFRHRPALQRAASIICLIALSATLLVTRAQQTAPATKRALTHQDYDSWRSISGSQISREGKFVGYASGRQDGDGEIVVRNIAAGTDWRAPRGYRPPVPPPDDPGANMAEFQAEQARLPPPVFTADSRFLVFGIEPTKAEVNKAKKDKRKPEDIPKNALGIMDLSTRTGTRAERVKTFRVPEDGSGVFAYLLEAKPEEKPSSPSPQSSPPGSLSPATESTAAPSPAARPQSGRSSRKKEYGTELVLQSLAHGNERRFSDVLDFTISKDAKTLVFTTSSRKEETNGVYAVPTDGDGQ